MLHLLPEAVERAAHHDPEWPAMRFGADTLTYGDLATRSTQLAHTLLDLGVEKGDRVGIFADKGLFAGIAIYGIMKAGGAYVPLDPNAPLSRNEQIVADGGVDVVVAEPASRDRLFAFAATTGIRAAVGVEEIEGVETLSWGSVETAPEDRPHADPTEHDLAYVLYTSGSTGAPKGVAHTHRSGLAFAEVAAATYGFTHRDRLTNHAPLQFDLSTMDYFSAAVVGATTVIVPEVHTKFPASLSTLLQDEKVTVLYAVPFALTQLLIHGALDKRDLSSIRWVLFGGEPFPPKYLKALMDRLPDATFSNVYGPTEVNGVTYWIVPPIAAGSEEPIPIGRVYDGVEAVVVDEKGSAVTRGGAGELLIRSPTVMRGYWGRPDLDERVFEDRPVDTQVDGVFFRTGDLVREGEAGVFDFLGRRDRQIKTRGYRVELDEVEAALLRHEDVLQGAAYSIPDGQGSQSIAACAVTVPESALTADALLDSLRATLPVYAIPTLMEFRTALPRTSTGKVDRVKLRADAIASTTGDEIVERVPDREANS